MNEQKSQKTPNFHELIHFSPPSPFLWTAKRGHILASQQKDASQRANVKEKLKIDHFVHPLFVLWNYGWLGKRMLASEAKEINTLDHLPHTKKTISDFATLMALLPSANFS